MRKTLKKAFTIIWMAALYLSCEDPAASASPPESPPSLSVEAGHNRLKVSWDRTEDADSYEVWYGTSGEPGEAERFAGETSGGSIVIPNLENGVDYYIKARPKNANGTGPWSEVVRDTPVDTKGVPQNLAVEAGDSVLSLSWELLWDAASYEVFYSAPNANLEILDKVKCAEEPEEGKITINLDDYLYRYHVWVRAKYDDGSTGDYSDSGEGKIYKVINTELYDMGYFLEQQTSVVQDNPDNPYKIVLTDFYSSIRELEKLAVYTKGKYVDLDMGGLTNLWITALAPEKENRDKIVSIVFPRDIENIPDHCCNGMRNLRYVELPRRLTRIGDSAFQNCSLLNFSDGIYLPEVEFELGMYSLRVNCETVDLSNLKSIESASLSLGYNVKAVIMNRTVPPQIVVDCYYNHRWYENPNYPEFCTRCPPIGGSGFIYVPDESLEVYQTGSAWRFMAGSFKPLSELPEEYR